MQVIAIVHEDAAVAAEWAVGLSTAGFRVITSGSFEDGKALLAAAVPPALLIVSVRLGAYNGLHLVIRGKLDHPEMAAIVASETFDATLEDEVRSYGAIYLSGPADRETLVVRAVQVLADAAV
jgi:ActR/RegA family two-component response regulator